MSNATVRLFEKSKYFYECGMCRLCVGFTAGADIVIVAMEATARGELHALPQQPLTVMSCHAVHSSTATVQFIWARRLLRNDGGALHTEFT